MRLPRVLRRPPSDKQILAERASIDARIEREVACREMATGTNYVPAAVSNTLTSEERRAVPKGFEPWFSAETQGVHLVVGYRPAAKDGDQIKFLNDQGAADTAVCAFALDGSAWPEPSNSLCLFLENFRCSDVHTDLGETIYVELAKVVINSIFEYQKMNTSYETQGDRGVRP